MLNYDPPSPNGNLLLFCFNFSSLSSALAALFCNSSLSSFNFCLNNRRVSRGGGAVRGPWPPLGMKSKKRANFKLFCCFFSRKHHFLSWSPHPPEKLNSQKKYFQIFAPPPPLIILGHATENFSITLSPFYI